MKKMLQTALLLLSFVAAGCGTNPASVVTSLDDVTSESDVEGAFFSLTQTKSVALNGLLPILPGDLCYAKSKHSPFSAICFAPTRLQNAENYHTSEPKFSGQSFYRSRTIGEEVTGKDVVTVRNNLEKMVRAAEKYLEAKLTLAKFDIAQAANPSSSKPDQQSEKKTEKETEKTTGEVTTTTTNETNETTTDQPVKTMQEGTAKLGGESVNKVTKESSVANLPAETRAQMVASVRESGRHYDTTLDSFKTELTKTGLIVFQWDAVGKTLVNGQFGTLAGATFSDSKERSGFAVVGGIRISQLFVGKDILNVESVWPQVASRIEKSRNAVIPTTLYQAKYITYFSEMERLPELQAKLSATLDQLATMGADPGTLALEKTDLSLAISRMYRITNTALMGAGTLENHEIFWGTFEVGKQVDCTRKCEKHDRSCQGSEEAVLVNNTMGNVACKPESWLSFYQIGTELKDLQDLVENE